MIFATLLPLCLAYPLALGEWQRPEGGGDAPLHAFAPAGTFAWIETTAHAPLVAQGLEHPWMKKVLDSPLVKAEFSKRGVDPYAAIEAAKAALGASPFDILSGLTSDGIAIGLVPGFGKEPRPFAIMRGSDADAFEDALDPLVDALSGFDAIRKIAIEKGKALGDHVEGAWNIGGGAAFAAAFDDQTIIITTNLADLTSCAKRATKAEGLAASRAGFKSMGDTFAWLDLDTIEKGGELRDLRAMTTNAGAHFALGPVLTHFGSASTLGFDIDFNGDAITSRMRAEGTRAGKGAASFPGQGRKAPRCPKPAASEVGRIHLYRDIETLLDLRTDLFEAQALPGIAEGIAGVALILGGPDATEEVIDAIDPHWLVLFDDVEFDPAAAPDVPIPSATGVFHLANPEVNGMRLVQAFQSLISLQNVQRAMQGRSGFLLSLRPVNSHTMTVASLPAPGGDGGVDVGYNLAPACAAVGDHFVIGTHHASVASAVERISSGQLERTPDDTLDQASISSKALANLVASNRDILQMNAMLKEGKAKSQATMEIDVLLALLGGIESFDFETADPGALGGTDGQGSAPLEARLTVRLAR